MHACMHGWMDGCMHGWMYGWMDGWMDGWLDGCMHVCIYTCEAGVLPTLSVMVPIGYMDHNSPEGPYSKDRPLDSKGQGHIPP